MAKKHGAGSKKTSDDQDLTRIEDLSELLHPEDFDLDMKFKDFFRSEEESMENELKEDGEEGLSLENMPEKLDTSQADYDNSPPDLPIDSLPSSVDEILFIDTIDDEEEQNEAMPEDLQVVEEISFAADPEEKTFSERYLEENSEKNSEENSENNPHDSSESNNSYDHYNDRHNGMLTDDIDSSMFTEPAANISIPPEKFEDVKNFAQNFSYGKTSTEGGNPPYTLIARHIRFKEDAEDILGILEELGVLNGHNEKDLRRSAEFGSLIVPQISEYTAIVLAHKLRRFDVDLEVGLSDEIHPSKTGEVNPKGLLKKENLKQNRSEALKFKEIDFTIKDIIVSTTSSIPGYVVQNYIGVQTSFSIVEESELEKLQYVERAQREHTELYDYNSSELTTEKAFKDYQNSFALLYADLTMQLKQKAFTQKANALLGLNFQLSPLQFDRSHARVSAYQITCSATLALVDKEN